MAQLVEPVPIIDSITAHQWPLTVTPTSIFLQTLAATLCPALCDQTFLILVLKFLSCRRVLLTIMIELKVVGLFCPYPGRALLK